MDMLSKRYKERVKRGVGLLIKRNIECEVTKKILTENVELIRIRANNQFVTSVYILPNANSRDALETTRHASQTKTNALPGTSILTWP